MKEISVMNRKQVELFDPGNLLDSSGKLSQIGWARHPYLDCNLEDLHFCPIKSFQFLRVKRWDYYAVFTPQKFFSATIADLGYAGNIFVYILDYDKDLLHEEGLVIPLGRGIILPRNSTSGVTEFKNKNASLCFEANGESRSISVDWPEFHGGRGISAEISFSCPASHESMSIVIPFSEKRFYYNRKINCLPANGTITYDGDEEKLVPSTSIGTLDWGRGVWPYRSFWNWASSSGFLPDGRTIGLNLGKGFGDLSQATENCVILDGLVHKLDEVDFIYDPENFMTPWHFRSNDNQLILEFIPFKERAANTNLGIIHSEVHQLFGRYNGQVTTDEGETIQIQDLIGFAEEHYARW